MWGTVLKWVAQMLLIPLIKDGVTALYDYLKNRAEQKKKLAEAKKKAEDYVNAKDEATLRDTFNKLP